MRNAKARVSAPAVFRTRAPTPTANRPQTSTYSAATTTDRSTPGWDRDMDTCVLDSSVRPRKYEPKLVANDTTRLTAANTAAFAAYSVPRRGITVSEVRIMPVEYSEVIIRAPSTTMTSWPSRARPRTLSWAPSKLARSGADMVGHECTVP